jgi:hypothetical protein
MNERIIQRLDDINECLRMSPDNAEALLLKDEILRKSYYAMSVYG